MKIEIRGRSKHSNEDLKVEEFFSDMTSCFTEKEWKKISMRLTGFIHKFRREAHQSGKTGTILFALDFERRIHQSSWVKRPR